MEHPLPGNAAAPSASPGEDKSEGVPTHASGAADSLVLKPRDKPDNNEIYSRWTWPRLWELTLAVLLGGALLLVAQSAWRTLRAPKPLLAEPAGVDLNTADEGTLRQLPGVGPHLAARIIEYREKHGPFRHIDDLKAVKGIGPVTLERLRPVLLIGAAKEAQPIPVALHNAAKPGEKAPRLQIDLNTATRDQLISVPGIGPALAERILQDRKENGPYQSVSDLTRVRGIKAKTLEKLVPYLKVTGTQKHV